MAGQRHIGVDGPLAGRLLDGRVLDPGATATFDAHAMNVAEAEFAFRMADALPGRSTPYRVHEVLEAVASLHPAIEIPDSRYTDFARAGAPQLIADTACACWTILGAATRASWRERDLPNHRVLAYRNGALAGEGLGSRVLGDPRIALTWLANELNTHGDGLRAGDVVITGTCVTPVPIASGDRIRMDFGELGAIDAALSG